MNIADQSTPVVIESPRRSRGFLLAKRAVQAACFLMVLPRLVCYRIGHTLLGARDIQLGERIDRPRSRFAGRLSSPGFLSRDAPPLRTRRSFRLEQRLFDDRSPRR